jgi:hypothetical protein
MEPNILHRNRLRDLGDTNRNQLPSQKSYAASLADEYTECESLEKGYHSLD